MVSLHNHDRSHHRAYGLQDTTPANDEVMYRRAIDAGADIVLGSGPHVLRGIEWYKGKPIIYSLSNFIYQYRHPGQDPGRPDHQRDGEIARPTNVSVWDRRDPVEIFEGVMARLTFNREKITRIELIPFTIDDEGPLYGAPRLASSAGPPKSSTGSSGCRSRTGRRSSTRGGTRGQAAMRRGGAPGRDRNEGEGR